MNQKVIEIYLNHSTDTSDLVGNYDQDDLHRKANDFISKTTYCLTENIVQELISSNKIENIELGKTILISLGQIQFITSTSESLKKIKDIFDNLDKSMHLMSALLPPEKIQNIKSLKEESAVFEELLSNNKSGSWFSWFNSELIKGARDGSWVFLYNVDECNAAILERINPLLEINQKFYINESSDNTGKSQKFVPHKAFKLFLFSTQDNSKISRAIRNRCLELNLNPVLGSNIDLSHRVKKILKPASAMMKSEKEQGSEKMAATSEINQFWNELFKADFIMILNHNAIFDTSLCNKIYHIMKEVEKNALLEIPNLKI